MQVTAVVRRSDLRGKPRSLKSTSAWETTALRRRLAEPLVKWENMAARAKTYEHWRMRGGRFHDFASMKGHVCRDCGHLHSFTGNDKEPRQAFHQCRDDRGDPLICNNCWEAITNTRHWIQWPDRRRKVGYDKVMRALGDVVAALIYLREYRKQRRK